MKDLIERLESEVWDLSRAERGKNYLESSVVSSVIKEYMKAVNDFNLIRDDGTIKTDSDKSKDRMK